MAGEGAPGSSWRGAGQARRRWVPAILAGAAILLAASPPVRQLAAVPHRVRVTRGEALQIASRLPSAIYVRSDRGGALRVNGRELPAQRWRAVAEGKLAVEPLRTGRYELELRAYRLLPVRRVTVEVVPPVAMAPGGQSIGVIVDPGGVVVVEEAAVRGPDGRRRLPAREAGVRAGDLIVAVDGRPVEGKEEIAAAVADAGQRGEPLRLTVRRGDREWDVNLEPVYDQDRQRYLIGLWVRDGATGIGTLTFFDPATGRYGALGHQVTDGAGQPYRFASGAVIDAFISGIRPGRPGMPGEKIGVFLNREDELGTIERNTPLGIYGRLLRLPERRGSVPVALEGEVRTGKAELITVVRGQQPERFEVVVERVYPQGRPSDKGMVVRVTDPRLLAATGGIVQGMSGSPLLQDGRLIGAVTHVFVNDPTRGYAVFAEWMVRELQSPGTLVARAAPSPARAAFTVKPSIRARG